MGYRVGSACFEDFGAATDAFYSAVPPSSSLPVTGGYIEILTLKTGLGDSAWQRVSNTCLYNNCTQTSVVDLGVPLFPDCDPAEAFQDGMTVGWGVVAACAVAFAAVAMRRALR